MAKSRDYQEHDLLHQAQIAWWLEKAPQFYTSYQNPRRQRKYWKGNRRNAWHRHHKRVMARKVRSVKVDEEGLCLSPFIRRCVGWMER